MSFEPRNSYILSHLFFPSLNFRFFYRILLLVCLSFVANFRFSHPQFHGFHQLFASPSQPRMSPYFSQVNHGYIPKYRYNNSQVNLGILRLYNFPFFFVFHTAITPVIQFTNFFIYFIFLLFNN